MNLAILQGEACVSVRLVYVRNPIDYEIQAKVRLVCTDTIPVTSHLLAHVMYSRRNALSEQSTIETPSHRLSNKLPIICHLMKIKI